MNTLYTTILKRILDIALSFILMAVFSPLLLSIGLAVRILLGKPVFFLQRRIGFNTVPFNLIKFRTLKNIRDIKEKLLPDQERMTSFGGFLRRSSLDELSELYNVLKGDMSLVGPRPLLPQYLTRYTQEQMRRHVVRPGITGWAQVNGRNLLTWEKRFELDIWYVDHMSLKLDIIILWMTLIKALKREGISAEGHATMPEFLGTKAGRDEY